jgi:hypothetical protein
LAISDEVLAGFLCSEQKQACRQSKLNCRGNPGGLTTMNPRPGGFLPRTKWIRECVFIGVLGRGQCQRLEPLKSRSRKKEILDAVIRPLPVREVGREHRQRAGLGNYDFLDGAGEIGIIGSVRNSAFVRAVRASALLAGRQMLVTCLVCGNQDLILKGCLSDRGHPTRTSLLEVAKIWSARTVFDIPICDWEARSGRRGVPSRHHKKIEMITLGADAAESRSPGRSFQRRPGPYGVT